MLLKHPVVKKGQCQARIGCKLDTSGNNAVKYWDASGQRCELPFPLRGWQLDTKQKFQEWMVYVEGMWYCLLGCRYSPISLWQRTLPAWLGNNKIKTIVKM